MADTPEDSNEQKDGPTLADGVRLIVLGWSATLLTISYLGIFPGMKMDSTFVASLLTGAMAGFGIERKSGNVSKKDSPKIPTNEK
jgi:hypothetical protein|tara:strand:- start:138 stop:392 length:255 start_codon:yes stop_codon:yes gene_type:complete